MEMKADLRYTKDHEWVRLERDTAYVGITDHAQEEMGAIVFVDLPAIGRLLHVGDVLAVVESVKAASDVMCAVSGSVSAVNGALAEHPELLNEDPYGQFIASVWPVHADALLTLMDEDAYRAFTEAGG